MSLRWHRPSIISGKHPKTVYFCSMTMSKPHDTVFRPLIAPTERVWIVTTDGRNLRLHDLAPPELQFVTLILHFDTPTGTKNPLRRSAYRRSIDIQPSAPDLASCFLLVVFQDITWRVCDLPHRVSQHQFCPALPTMLSRQATTTAGTLWLKGTVMSAAKYPSHSRNHGRLIGRYFACAGCFCHCTVSCGAGRAQSLGVEIW
jgi:hypothetical protein